MVLISQGASTSVRTVIPWKAEMGLHDLPLKHGNSSYLLDTYLMLATVPVYPEYGDNAIHKCTCLQAEMQCTKVLAHTDYPISAVASIRGLCGKPLQYLHIWADVRSQSK